MIIQGRMLTIIGRSGFLSRTHGFLDGDLVESRLSKLSVPMIEDNKVNTIYILTNKIRIKRIHPQWGVKQMKAFG